MSFIADKYRKWRHRRAISRQVKDLQLITGVDNKTAARMVTADLVEKTLRNMMVMGFTGHQMYRVVQYKLGHINDLTKEERQFAETFIGELACVRGLAGGAWLDLEMLERYAWTGYQRLGIEFDPLFACIKESYRGGRLRIEDIDEKMLKKYLSECGAKEFRSFSPEVWHRATAGSSFYKDHSEAAFFWFDMLMEFLDSNRLRVLESLTDPTNRNVAVASKREAIESFLQELHKVNAALAG